MDMEKFEQLARDVSRRGVLRGVFGVLAGTGIAGGLLLDEAEAKRKGKKKGKGKKGNGKGGKRRGRGGTVRPQAVNGPTPLRGNPTCEDLGFTELSSIKVDPPDSGEYSQNIGSCTCTVDALVTQRPASGGGFQGEQLAFESDCRVTTVLVKAGPGANRYDLTGTDQFGASNLVPPNNPGGEQPDLSHFDFCGLACEGCTPNCTDKVCGSDGCGGLCGTCPGSNYTCPAGECICNPVCDGRECGSDSCGETCGECPSGEICDASGQCICDGSCAGRECGSDGCDGSCGTCPNGETCDVDGQCVCVPVCTGKTCGSDGCGGTCGPDCPKGETCNANGTCEPGTCVPDCDGKKCGGDDGCYGICGCPGDKVCKKGLCCAPNVSAAATKRRLAKRRRSAKRSSARRRSKR